MSECFIGLLFSTNASLGLGQRIHRAHPEARLAGVMRWIHGLPWLVYLMIHVGALDHRFHSQVQIRDAKLRGRNTSWCKRGKISLRLRHY